MLLNGDITLGQLRKPNHSLPARFVSLETRLNSLFKKNNYLLQCIYFHQSVGSVHEISSSNWATVAVNEGEQQSVTLKSKSNKWHNQKFYLCAPPFHLTGNWFSSNLPTKWIRDAVWAVKAESQTSTWPSTAIWLLEDAEQAEPDQAEQRQQERQSSSGAKWTRPG